MGMILCLIFAYVAGAIGLRVADFMANDYPTIEVERANKEMIKEYGRVLTREEMLGMKPLK